MQSLIKLAEIFGAEAFVYNGTNSNPKEFIDLIVKNQLEPGRGAGSMYGKGLYTVYDLSDTPTGRGEYGNYVYKLKVNLYGFVSFNPDITEKIYGKRLKPSQQYQMFSRKKDNVFKNLEIIESKELGDNQTSSEIAVEASKFLAGKVKGIIFTGKRDKGVAVIYDASTAIPISWMDLNYPDVWNKFDKEEIKPAVGKEMIGSFQESKYETINTEIYDKTRDQFLSSLPDQISEKDPIWVAVDRYAKEKIEHSSRNFLENYSSLPWAKRYVNSAIETWIKNLVSRYDIFYFLSVASGISGLDESHLNFIFDIFEKNNYLNDYLNREIHHGFNYLTGFLKEYSKFVEGNSSNNVIALKDKLLIYAHKALELYATREPLRYIWDYYSGDLKFHVDDNIVLYYLDIAHETLLKKNPGELLIQFGKYEFGKYEISKPYVRRAATKEGMESLLRQFDYDYDRVIRTYGNNWWFKFSLIKEIKKEKDKKEKDKVASISSLKILKLSKILNKINLKKESNLVKSLIFNNYKFASDQTISGKFKLNDLDKSLQNSLYEVFKESYIKATGQAWSEDLFFSRASAWTFYGIVGELATGVVAIREQPSGLNKLVAIAGNGRGILAGIKFLKEDKSESPIWGAVSPEMIPMVERFGFKVATEEELARIAERLPNHLRRQIGNLNPDGSFQMNIAEVGETTKKFIYNDVYGNIFS